jgi:hypothetical protein
MRERRRDPLRELLDREIDAFTAEAARDAGNLSAQRIEGLGHLARLIEIRNSLRQKPRNWWAALVLMGTLAVVSLLLFARIPETDIELEVSLAESSFALAKDQVLTSAMELSALGVSGLRGVQLPRSRGESREVSQTLDDSNPAISLTRSSIGKRHGTVTLAPLLLAAGTRVTLHYSELPNQCQLSTNAAGLALQATVDGPVTVGPSGSPAREMDFTSPRPVLLEGGSEETELDLTFSSMPQSPFSPQLQVQDLSFARIDQFLGPDRTLVKRLSTILSGTLYLESLNGQERRLRPGEELRFERSQGEIRTLELADHHIGLKFHGRVRGMTTGAGEGHRSLMPTYLEWLWARHGLSLLWATSLYIFGLIASALRWWGV